MSEQSASAVRGRRDKRGKRYAALIKIKVRALRRGYSQFANVEQALWGIPHGRRKFSSKETTQ
jgi:hypothetical protein